MFLFLQVPFKRLLGNDVFLIIKVFSNIMSQSVSEQEHVWTPDLGAGTKATRNVFKFYEGFTLVNISDVYWKRNLRCGEYYEHPIDFLKPDKN